MVAHCSVCGQWIPTGGGVHNCPGGSGGVRRTFDDVHTRDAAVPPIVKVSDENIEVPRLFDTN